MRLHQRVEIDREISKESISKASLCSCNKMYSIYYRLDVNYCEWNKLHVLFKV